MVTRVQAPEIRKYKRKFNGEILCGALWGVNLLVGTDNGLLLLDRSGHGKGLCVREGGKVWMCVAMGQHIQSTVPPFLLDVIRAGFGGVEEGCGSFRN